MKLVLSIALIFSGVGFLNADGHLDTIKNDPVYKGIIKGVEERYSVECSIVEASIQWHCLNGPDCFSQVPVSCRHPKTEATVGLPYAVSIELNGYDDQKSYKANEIKITEAQ